jgi:hypothetical protein
MTVTDIRPRLTAMPEPTAESAELAEIDAQIAAVTVKLADPQGWGKELADERSRLLGLRAELLAAAVELTATTVLAA